ncbi:CPBP family intramembrane glutamic endopeptidase [Haloparvum sedimenti]|uniref:CPBP family intramembrane glutamic endopeptidase n=1 Tax=Haloparvum sedimenti TaxID=1678448 RepID=UPI00071E8CFB|nr:CPBP family intramembrane glutamic endopeptidase [Haloparvum sedimenti]
MTQADEGPDAAAGTASSDAAEDARVGGPESEELVTDPAAAAFRLGQAVLVVLGAFFAAVAVTGWGTDALVGLGLLTPDTSLYTVAGTVLQFLGFGIGVAGFLALVDEPGLIRVRALDRRDALLTVGGVVVLLALQFVLLYALQVLGLSTGENQAMLPGREDPTYFLYMVVVSVLFVGPAEELLFRGVVQGLLRRAFAAWPAILIAGAFFGLIHAPAVQGGQVETLLYAVVATLLGCLLGYLYERSGNLAVPAIAHGLYNATLFGIQYAAAVGL